MGAHSLMAAAGSSGLAIISAQEMGGLAGGSSRLVSFPEPEDPNGHTIIFSDPKADSLAVLSEWSWRDVAI